MIKNKFEIVFFFLIVTQLYPQDNKLVEAQVDTMNLRIGEQLTYQIRVKDPTATIVFPNLDELNTLELVGTKKIDTLEREIALKYLLTSFDSGHYNIPRQKILIDQEAFFTDSIVNIVFKDVAVDTTKQNLYPIKDIKQENKTIFDYGLSVLGYIFILSFIGIIVYILFRKKRQRKSKMATLSPIDEAIYRFEALDKVNWLTQGSFKKQYVELVDIVRSYLNRDLSIQSLEATTDELMLLLKRVNQKKELEISNENFQELLDFLQFADLVKFAKLKPKQSKAEQHRIFAQDFIKEVNKRIDLYRAKEQEKVGIAEEKNSKIKFLAKGKKRKFSIAVLIASIVLISLFVYFSTDQRAFRYLKEELLGHKWVSSEYGYPGIKITTPQVLTYVDNDTISQINQQGDKVRLFVNTQDMSSSLIIYLATVQYSQKTNISLDRALSLCVQILENTEGVSDVQIKETTPISKNGINGNSLKGLFNFKRHKMSFSLQTYIQDSSIQMIMLMYRFDDKASQEKVNEIFESIELNKIK